MRLVLDKLEEYQPGNLQLKQFAGDLANTIKTSYENKIRPAVTGGTAGAGKFGGSFFESLGLTGMAKSYKEKAEAKEKRHQEKEGFIQNFQQYSDAGKTLSADTSRQVADALFEELESKKKELEKLQEEAKKQKDAGYGENPENLKKQEEMIEAIKQLDPRNKEAQVDAGINDVKGEETKIEAAEIQKDAAEVQKKESDDLTALYTITDDHFKKQDKWQEDSLKFLETIAMNAGQGGGGGGLLDTVADVASIAKGRAGGLVGKAASTGGKLASLAGTAGKFAKVGGGLLAVGTAAYEGYNEYQEADEKVKSGEITKEEGQVKKGEAVGGAVGGGGGALAGAAAGAAIGSVVPVVGTAIGGLIGGAIGYWGGKKAGQAVGGASVQGYQALSGGSEAAPAAAAAAPAASAPAAAAPSEGTYSAPVTLEEKNTPLYQKIYKEELAKSPNSPRMAEKFANKRYKEEKNLSPAGAEAGAKTGAEKITPSSSSELSAKRVEVENASAAASGGSTSNTVNAPVTNVTNNVSNGGANKPEVKDTSNKDNTFQRYLDRRYYPNYAR